ncbi:MAG: hypothetical protein RLZZ244_126 [Verrucomicrobiota bacterium]
MNVLPLALLLTWTAAFLVPDAGRCASRVDRLEKERAALAQRLEALPPLPVPEQENAVGLYIGGAFSPDASRWIQIDLGEARELESVVLVPAYVAGKWGYGFPLRYRVEASMREDFAESLVLLDRSGWDHPVPKGPVLVRTPSQPCRYLRVIATRLAGHPMDARRSLFCLGEILAFAGGRNVALRGRVTAPGSAESLPTWSLVHVVDGSTALGVPMRADGGRGGNGWHSGISGDAETLKWVQVDLGEVRKVDEVRLVPARPSDFLERAGFGFPLRFRVEVSEDAAMEKRAVLFDSGERDFINPGGNAVGFPGRGIEGRYVRVSASRLWQRHQDFVFALAELEVFSGGRNVARGMPVAALDEVQTGSWRREALVDGRGSTGVLVDSQMWMEQLAERARGEEEMARVEQALGEARSEAAAREKRNWAGVLVVGLLAAGGWAGWGRVARRRAERGFREQIARDLHDEIGSSLGSIALMSERAARKGDREAMAEIGRLAVEASASMRGILWMVRGAGPLTLGDLWEALGSNAALMLEGKEWAWEDSLEEGEALRELPFHRDVFLFFKEALHNLVRHSRATRVWLGFRVERGALRIEVRDNGEGFDPSADYPGSGLVSMRHRAQQLGARLDLDSGPGRGTRIQLRIPLS